MRAATCCLEILASNAVTQIHYRVVSSTILHAWNELNDKVVKENQHLVNDPGIESETQAHTKGYWY